MGSRATQAFRGTRPTKSQLSPRKQPTIMRTFILLAAFAALFAFAAVDAAPNGESDRFDSVNVWTDEPTRCDNKCANGDEGKLNSKGECYCEASAGDRYDSVNVWT